MRRIEFPVFGQDCIVFAGHREAARDILSVIRVAPPFLISVKVVSLTLLENRASKEVGNVMQRIIVMFASLLFVTMLPLQAAAEALTDGKRADIIKLLDTTGAMNMGKQMSEMVVGQMTEALKASRPDLPPELFDILREEVSATFEENIPMFVELIVPIYHRHFTHEELKGLLSFYETDLGKKTIRVMPLLVQESMLIGQQWGQTIGPEIERRVIERFKAEGVDLSA